MSEIALAAQPLPLDPEQAREAMALYREMSSALLDPAEDLQVIQTRSGPSQFPKRSAFQKLANAYRVSTEIRSEVTDRAEDGTLLRHRAIVRATHPDGRFAEGDGACAASEERFKRGGDKIEHDLPATAVTRATNRAISNLVAFGAVSAEEAESETNGSEPASVAAAPPWAEHVEDVPHVADQLVDLLGALGVQDPGRATGKVGQAIFDACSDGIPRAAALAIEQLHQFVIVTSARDPLTSAGKPAAPSEGAQAPDLPPEPQRG